MPRHARQRRRLVGLLFLGIALLLVVAGQTLLRAHLHGLLFLLYWLACILALVLAVATALLDILLVRQEARQEQLELLRETLIHAAPRQPPADVPPRAAPPSAESGPDRARISPDSDANTGKI